LEHRGSVAFATELRFDESSALSPELDQFLVATFVGIAQGILQRIDATAFEKPASFTMSDYLGDAADSRSDNRFPHRQAFEDAVGGVLVPLGWQYGSARAANKCAEFCAGLVARETDRSRQS